MLSVQRKGRGDFEERAWGEEGVQPFGDQEADGRNEAGGQGYLLMPMRVSPLGSALPRKKHSWALHTLQETPPGGTGEDFQLSH